MKVYLSATFTKNVMVPFVIYADFEAILEKVSLSVAMTINIVNQFRYIEQKMLFICSWEKCQKKSIRVKK